MNESILEKLVREELLSCRNSFYLKGKMVIPQKVQDIKISNVQQGDFGDKYNYMVNGTCRIKTVEVEDNLYVEAHYNFEIILRIKLKLSSDNQKTEIDYIEIKDNRINLTHE